VRLIKSELPAAAAVAPVAEAPEAPIASEERRRPARTSALNARDLINGKRERPQFFDAEEEVKKAAAARKAAVAAERERQLEEQVEQWKEADRAQREKEKVGSRKQKNVRKWHSPCFRPMLFTARVSVQP